MPMVELSTSAALAPVQKEEITRELGRLISLFPGKSERWLMVRLEGDAAMVFGGEAATPCAMVSVTVFGTPGREACEAFAAAVTGLLGRVAGLAPERVYVRFGGTELWGWSGSLF